MSAAAFAAAVVLVVAGITAGTAGIAGIARVTRIAGIAAALASAVVRGPAVAARREELIKREREPVKRIARILCVAARAAAILLRHANIVSGHQQLDIALKADDRELPERHKQPIGLVIIPWQQVDILTEAAGNAARHFRNRAAAATAAVVSRFNDFCVEDDGVEDLCFCPVLGLFYALHRYTRTFPSWSTLI